MEEKTFRNLQMVAAYLKGLGYKVSKSTVYDHGKARKIKPREDGLFYLADVEAYAGGYLKLKNAQNVQHSSDTVQKRRNEAEARKMEAQAHHWEIKAQVAAGAYVERGAFEIALAQRAMVFKNDLESFARSHAPEICHLVSGDNDLIPELTEHLLEQFGVFLNRYAEEREFRVPAPAATTLDDLDRDDDETAADYLDNTPECKNN